MNFTDPWGLETSDAQAAKDAFNKVIEKASAVVGVYGTSSETIAWKSLKDAKAAVKNAQIARTTSQELTWAARAATYSDEASEMFNASSKVTTAEATLNRTANSLSSVADVTSKASKSIAVVGFALQFTDVVKVGTEEGLGSAALRATRYVVGDLTAVGVTTLVALIPGGQPFAPWAGGAAGIVVDQALGMFESNVKAGK